MWIQIKAAPKRIELQRRALSHLKDLFKSFQNLIWFSKFKQILSYNDGFYVPTFVTINTKQMLRNPRPGRYKNLVIAFLIYRV